jgi:hypothetical protein
MAYNKPEVTKIIPSLEGIQSQQVKVKTSMQDSPYPMMATPQAYEADE